MLLGVIPVINGQNAPIVSFNDRESVDIILRIIAREYYEHDWIR